MRGFIQGSLWGLVLGGAGVGLASLMSEQPNFAAGPSAPQLAAPQLDTVGPSPTVALQPSIDDTPTFAPAAALDDVADAAETAPEVSTAPATLPQTADVAAIIESPDTVSAPDISADVAAPAAPRAEAALVEPAPEGNVPQVDTRPAAALPGNDVVAQAPEAETATEEGATPAMAEASEPETVPLEEEEVNRIWDVVPWPEELDAISTVFGKLDPVDEKPCQ